MARPMISAGFVAQSLERFLSPPACGRQLGDGHNYPTSKVGARYLANAPPQAGFSGRRLLKCVTLKLFPRRPLESHEKDALRTFVPQSRFQSHQECLGVALPNFSLLCFRVKNQEINLKGRRIFGKYKLRCSSLSEMWPPRIDATSWMYSLALLLNIWRH